jgi:hypothetical protein
MSACVCHYARSRMLATDFAYHCPPRAVATPRAFKADAISLRVAAPAFCASRMIGSTLAANLSASAATASSALLQAAESLGLPRVTLRAFVAASAYGNAHYLFDFDTRIMLLWAGIGGLLSVDAELSRRLALYAALLHKGTPAEKIAHFDSPPDYEREVFQVGTDRKTCR